MATNSDVSAPSIPGLNIERVVGRGPASIIFRASRGMETVAVEIPARSGKSLGREQVQQFLRQGCLPASLSHPTIPAIHEVDTTAEGLPYIVREYIAGRVLAESIAESTLQQQSLLDLARWLADGLDTVHRRGLLHRDIHPLNILVGTDQVPRLVNFGIGTANHGNDIRRSKQSLPYASPEELGSDRVGIDIRSDLYSLGAVLFFCATGHPPFSIEDANSVVEPDAEAAAETLRDTRPDLDGDLRQLISSLLAKNPVDRPPSARHLRRRIDDILQDNDVEPHRMSASRPISDHRPSNQPVIHRTAFQQLLDLWSTTGERHQLHCVLVEGPAGSGKSFLADAVSRQAKTEKATCLSVSIRRHEPHPFSAIRRLFEPLFERFERDSKTRQTRLRQVIDRALDGRFDIVGPVLPMLSDLFPSQQPRHLSDTSEIRSRLLYDAIASMLHQLAIADDGMVIVIDNAHWLDEVTQRVIEHLTNIDEPAPILLIAVADTRDTDHAVDRLPSTLGPRLDTRLTLGRLGLTEVRKLISERLSASSVDAALVERVYRASQGNAYAVDAYLQLLLDGAAIRPHQDDWRLETDAVEALDLPASLTELLDDHLARLREPTRQLLSWLALFEASPTTRQLADCTDLDSSTLDAAARQAIRNGLLETDLDGRWRLTDDTLRFRLIDRLDDDERKRRHHNIAEALDDGPGSDEHLFQIARHYARGQTEKSPERTVSANQRAGEVARAHCAFTKALECLRQAVEIATEQHIEADQRLHAHLGEVAVRTGHLDIAQRHLDLAIERTNDPIDRAQLRTSVIRMHSTTMQVDVAKREIRHAFQDLGEQLPQPQLLDVVSTLSKWSRGELMTRFPSLGNWLHRSGNEMSRRRMQALMNLYSAATRVAYLDFDEGLFVQLMMRHHDLAARLEDSAELAQTHIALAFVAANIDSDRWYQFHRRRARQQAHRASDRGVGGAGDVIDAMALELRGEVRQARSLMRQAVLERGHWIDAWEYSSGTLILIGKACLSGRHRQALDIADRAIRQLQTRLDSTRSESSFMFTAIAAMALMPMAMVGRTEDTEEYLGLCERYFESTDEKLYYHAVIHHSLLGYRLVRDELQNRADEHIAAFESLPMSFPDIPYFLRSFLVWKAWIYLRRAERQQQDGSAPDLDALRGAIDDLGDAAQTDIYRAYYELFCAGIADLEQRNRDIDAHLVAARRLADDIGMPIINFEVALRRARLHRRRGADDVATQYARRAHQLAVDHDWKRPIQRLRTEFGPWLTDHSESSSRIDVDETEAVNKDARRQIDAIRRIHRHLHTLAEGQPALARMLGEIVESVGGERAYLFQRDDNHIGVVASTTEGPASADDAPGDWARGVVDQVFATEETLLISTARQGRRWDENTFHNNIQSAVAVPISSHQQLSGLLYLDSRTEGVFSGDDVDILKMSTPGLAAVWQTQRADKLQDELERTGKQRTTLLEHATRAVGIGLAILTPDEALKTASPIVYTLAQSWGSLPRWWDAVISRCQWDHTKLCSQCGETEFLGTAVADVTTPDGQRHIFELTSTGHGHELTDEPTDHMVLVQDATERISAQEELQQLNDELVDARDEAMAASRAKSAFLANMSHELRTPLNAIIGYSEMLHEEADDSDPQMLQDLERIRVSGKHLLALVSDILNLSKIETGRLDLETESIELAGVIDDIADTAEQLVESNRNTLVVDDVPPIEIVNDETKLRQILLNLLGNAAKFTENGQIRLSIELEDAPHGSDERWLKFDVADDGIGMTEDQLQSLFEAFYQAQPGSVSKHGGTGLGLTISRRFCELMGGDIDVDSEVDVGTTFTVRLPVNVES